MSQLCYSQIENVSYNSEESIYQHLRVCVEELMTNRGFYKNSNFLKIQYSDKERLAIGLGHLDELEFSIANSCQILRGESFNCEISDKKVITDSKKEEITNQIWNEIDKDCFYILYARDTLSWEMLKYIRTP